MDDEMQKVTDLDLIVDTQVEMLESYLGSLELDIVTKDIEEDFRYRGDESNNFERKRNQNRVRLPKLEIRKFNGDPTLWPEFSDTFNIAIHKNTDLSDIERFTYLKGYLTGEAARCIEGFTLTAANYSKALDLLKDRFGNKKLIISKHMDALLGLEKV